MFPRIQLQFKLFFFLFPCGISRPRAQVQFGEANLFRFNHPTQALLMRQQGVQLPNRPAVLHSEMAAAARAEEQTRVAKEQMRVELENEKEMIRLVRC